MKKIIFTLAVVSVLVCLLAISVSAEVTVYDDAPERTNIIVLENDLVVFDDGFCCPTGYVFKDVTEIANGWKGGAKVAEAFDFSYIKEKTGKSYSFSNVVSVDFPQGMTYIGGYGIQGQSNLKRVSFPNTITGFGMSVLADCTALEECVFEHSENDNLATLCPEFFANCANLKAISLPDCITTFGWNSTGNLDGAYFAGCTSLGAIYLPKKLQLMYGNFDERAVFGMLENAYFVNEPFDYDNIPEKPEIYYFPSGLELMTRTPFTRCKNLNSVLVFGEGTKIINNGYEFEGVETGNGQRPTIVFLGDTTSINANGWNVSAIYFANKNDIDAASAGITNAPTTYFCYAEGNTNHIYAIDKSKAPTCTQDGVYGVACFCGAEIADVISAQHDYGKTPIASGWKYANNDYTKNAVYEYACQVCSGKYTKGEEIANSRLFTCLGYSAPENGTGGIALGFMVDKAAIDNYEKISGKTIKYGIFAVSQEKLGDAEIFGKGGATSGVLSADVSAHGFSMFELKVIGFTEEQKGMKLAMGAYVGIKEGNETTYSYMQDDSEGDLIGNYYFVSYNEVAGVVPAE